MAVIELLVQVTELIAAANDLNQAVETYREAVETAKGAAGDLASKWEGESQKAFVEQQENAYTWHGKIIAIVREMVTVIRKVGEVYNQAENAVKSIVQG